jgi:ABC-2 type transport system ATP-binding protein
LALALDIRSLTKTYAGGLQALRGIDLAVDEGDFFALLGPNGAGKSTTIGILCSLVVKTSGTVEIFGRDMDRFPVETRRDIGVVPQEFNFSVFERVYDIVHTQAGFYGISGKQARIQTEKHLRAVDLWDKRKEQARHLSGGMKRRLMIARALVHDPGLLILDEPTAGVDIEIRRSMWELMRQMNQEGTTIILTTHYLEEAESLCRNIAIIDHGRIIEHSTMKALLGRMEHETFVLDLADPLQSAPELPEAATALVDPHCLEVTVRKGTTLNDLFTLLKEGDVHVLSLRNKSNRLEQLFLDLVDQSREPARANGAQRPEAAA